MGINIKKHETTTQLKYGPQKCWWNLNFFSEKSTFVNILKDLWTLKNKLTNMAVIATRIGEYGCASKSITVDGRNPSPVDRWFISLFTRFYTSQVVQGFFHQLYHLHAYKHKKDPCQVFLLTLIPYNPTRPCFRFKKMNAIVPIYYELVCYKNWYTPSRLT